MFLSLNKWLPNSFRPPKICILKPLSCSVALHVDMQRLCKCGYKQIGAPQDLLTIGITDRPADTHLRRDDLREYFASLNSNIHVSTLCQRDTHKNIPDV